jgi:hypothetical protein
VKLTATVSLIELDTSFLLSMFINPSRASNGKKSVLDSRRQILK